jgi:hypothetical protein
MPTPTYTALATVTLASSASSVTFSSIPATYRDLIIVLNGTTNASSGIGARFNSDSGSNYSGVRMIGSSAGAISDSFSSLSRILQTAGNTSLRTAFISQVMDYSATDKHKTVLTRHNITNDTTAAIAARWANTAAVTTIQIFATDADTIATGTVISLYGVIA